MLTECVFERHPHRENPIRFFFFSPVWNKEQLCEIISFWDGKRCLRFPCNAALPGALNPTVPPDTGEVRQKSSHAAA